MEPNAAEICAAAKSAACRELDSALRKIAHCLRQLSDEQVWWRPAAGMNSIGNLILHLCGNVRQWIVAGIGAAEDTRNRPQEFAEQGPIDTVELLQRLTIAVSEAQSTIAVASADTLVATHRIQGFEVTGISAVFDSVSHFRGHTQEIVHLTRDQLGDSYEFDFVPAGPEQGA